MESWSIAFATQLKPLLLLRSDLFLYYLVNALHVEGLASIDPIAARKFAHDVAVMSVVPVRLQVSKNRSDSFFNLVVAYSRYGADVFFQDDELRVFFSFEVYPLGSLELGCCSSGRLRLLLEQD